MLANVAQVYHRPPSGQTENHDSDYDSAYDSATFTDMVQYKYILNAQNKDTCLLDHRAASWCLFEQ